MEWMQGSFDGIELSLEEAEELAYGRRSEHGEFQDQRRVQGRRTLGAVSEWPTICPVRPGL